MEKIVSISLFDKIGNFLIKRMVGAFESSYRHINTNIIDYLKLENNKKTLKILDLGCSDFKVTKKYLKNVKNYELHAVDIENKIDNKNIKYIKLDLEKDVLPYKNNFFDIIIAGQVIEHILNKDWFLQESYRVLKSKGLFICATENIASFDNILSLILGQEPLSQHTGSKYNTNSFISPHFMKKVSSKFGNKYAHKNVCSYYGLTRLVKINGFLNFKIISLGNINIIFEKIFKIYNRLLIVYAIK
ncbi:MAG: class I SAM-dependent methyltransferase [Candidatus Shapirobacteria bacterium]